MMLAPDWLRIGQDIVGGTPFPTFNFAFTLSGEPAAADPARTRQLSQPLDLTS